MISILVSWDIAQYQRGMCAFLVSTYLHSFFGGEATFIWLALVPTVIIKISCVHRKYKLLLIIKLQCLSGIKEMVGWLSCIASQYASVCNKSVLTHLWWRVSIFLEPWLLPQRRLKPVASWTNVLSGLNKMFICCLQERPLQSCEAGVSAISAA
jgi:hypothetical protein